MVMPVQPQVPWVSYLVQAYVAFLLVAHNSVSMTPREPPTYATGLQRGILRSIGQVVAGCQTSRPGVR